MNSCVWRLFIRHIWEHSGWVMMSLGTLMLAGMIGTRLFMKIGEPCLPI
jgi:hypothetical protein